MFGQLVPQHWVYAWFFPIVVCGAWYPGFLPILVTESRSGLSLSREDLSGEL